MGLVWNLFFGFAAPKKVKFGNPYYGYVKFCIVGIFVVGLAFTGIVYENAHLLRTPDTVECTMAVIEVSPTLFHAGVDPINLWGHLEMGGKSLTIPSEKGSVVEAFKNNMWEPEGMHALNGGAKQDFEDRRNKEPKDYPFTKWTGASLKALKMNKFGDDVFDTVVEVDAFSADFKRTRGISGLLWDSIPGRHYDKLSQSWVEQKKSPGAWTLVELLCMAENGPMEHCGEPGTFGNNIITIQLSFSNRQPWDPFARSPITFTMSTRENENLNVEPSIRVHRLEETRRQIDVEYGPQVILEASADIVEFSYTRLLATLAGYSFVAGLVNFALLCFLKNLDPMSDHYKKLLTETAEEKLPLLDKGEKDGEKDGEKGGEKGGETTQATQP